MGRYGCSEDERQLIFFALDEWNEALTKMESTGWSNKIKTLAIHCL